MQEYGGWSFNSKWSSSLVSSSEPHPYLITSLLYLISFPPKRPVYSAYSTVTSNHQQTSWVMVELHNTQPSLYSILSLEMPIKIKGMKIIFPAIRRYIIKTQGSKNNIAINNTWWHKCPNCEQRILLSHISHHSSMCTYALPFSVTLGNISVCYFG